MRIVVCGLAGHGKDVVCELLSKMCGLKFTSTSRFICTMPFFEKLRQEYPTLEACFEDRVNRRALWFETIAAFNKDDKCRLIREIFRENNIYSGLRNVEELREARAAGLVDLVLWVDAAKRVGISESEKSCTISAKECDVVLDNNGSLNNLRQNLQALKNRLVCRKQLSNK